MSLDELSTAAPGLETATETPVEKAPVEEVIELEGNAEGQGSDDNDAGTEGTEQPVDDGLVEVEIDGETYRVSEKVKFGIMMQKDYTQKTQEAASLKRDLEAQAAEIESRSKLTDDEVKARGDLSAVDSELKKYEGVDFARLQQEDPLAAQEHFMRFTQLKEARQNITGWLSEAQQQKAAQTEREFANRIAETQAAAKKLPGWTPELDAQIDTFATQELGLDRSRVMREMSPALYRALYLAQIGHSTLSKQAAPSKPASPALQPLQTVTPKGGTVRKTPAQMSVAEMSAYLNKRS